jgi:TonB family protein
MKQLMSILLALTSLIVGACRSLDRTAKTEPAASETPSPVQAAKTELARPRTPDTQITASIPNTSTLELVRPAYPPDVHVGGKVVVSVTIDLAGKVVAARGLSGHPLLKPLALEAARKSRFKGDSAQGRKSISGTITYIFTAADISYNELASLVGKPVTLRGKFSLNGKVGPLVLVDDKIVYLRSKLSFVWGRRYELMQDKVVTVTGTLRFFKEPPQPDFVRGVAVPKIGDYFYFQAEQASIELDQQ